MASLERSPNIRLLHLAGCWLGSGPIPGEVAARGLPMAVTGYGKQVQWSTAAIGDFVYLTLLLVHGLAPCQATAEAVKTAPFLGNEEGQYLKALDLRCQEPRIAVVE
jgi:hypothetical protein